MISTHSRTSQPRTAHVRAPRVRAVRQGFSLIEVAIALVIFVIGALAIIRIFPGALSVIGNNGNQQIATNLNRSVLTDLQSEQVALTSAGTAARVTFNAVPDAIFNNSETNGTLSIISWTGGTTNHSRDFRNTDNSVIGVARPGFNYTLPTTQDIEIDSSGSALSRHRAIIGEKAPAIELTFGVSTEVCALTQFPISVRPLAATAGTVPIRPVISQDVSLDDVRVKPDGTLDFSRARADGSDDITAVIEANGDSTLYVTYRYLNTDGVTWGIREESVEVLASATNLRTATLIKVRPPVTAGRRDSARVASGVVVDAIVPEIVEVRLRKYLGQGIFVGTQPEQVADARRGLVRLPAVDTAKPVVLDYIADWSFLLQDGVPSITPGSIPNPSTLTGDQRYRQLALGAPFIEDQAPASVYSLLIELDIAYRSGYGTAATNPAPADRLVRPTDDSAREDELRAGRATFIVEDSAARARVAYQTRDKWVQQLSVAARSYKPSGSGNAPSSLGSEAWRDYYLGDDNFLYFRAAEAGKTISISYRTSDDNGPLVDRPFVIETRLDNVPTAFYNGLGARVKLADKNGNPLPDDTTATPKLVSIQAVKGTSITSRTAYINGTKYAQKIDTTTRGANQ